MSCQGEDPLLLGGSGVWTEEAAVEAVVWFWTSWIRGLGPRNWVWGTQEEQVCACAGLAGQADEFEKNLRSELA